MADAPSISNCSRFRRFRRFPGRFLRFLRRSGSHPLHSLSEGEFIVAGANLARRVHELLALRPRVLLGLLGLLWHGRSLADLPACREVRHG